MNQRSARNNNQETAGLDLVQLYLKDAASNPLLSPEDEVMHASRIEAGVFAGKVIALRALDEQQREVVFADELEQQSAKKGPNAAQTAASNQYNLRRIIFDTKKYPIELLLEAESEGAASFNTMILSNTRLAISIAKKFKIDNKSGLDRIQDANAGLMRAVAKFDYQKGFKFSTYATWWIRQAIIRGIPETDRAIHLPSHIAEEVNRLDKVRKELTASMRSDPTTEDLAQELNTTTKRVTDLTHFSRLPVSLNMPLGDEGDGELGELFIDTRDEQTDLISTMQQNIDVAKVLDLLDDRSRELFVLRHGLRNGNPKTLNEISKIFNLSRERVRQIEAKAIQIILDTYAMGDDGITDKHVTQGYEKIEQEYARLNYKDIEDFPPLFSRLTNAQKEKLAGIINGIDSEKVGISSRDWAVLSAKLQGESTRTLSVNISGSYTQVYNITNRTYKKLLKHLEKQ